MSNSQIITPILVKIDNILYKLLYINFSPDGSIYIHFPRKKGYYVTKEVDLPNRLIGKQSFNLKDTQVDFQNPYISFHPNKKVIHINTHNGSIYKIDAEVINLSEDKSKLVFSLCQLVFPTFSYLDVYSSTKYTSPYILTCSSLTPKVDLCLEIWVHPAKGYIDITETPHFESRKKETNIVGAAVFNNKDINKYTCTLLVSELTNKDESVTTPGIFVLIFNETRPYAFQLKPK